MLTDIIKYMRIFSYNCLHFHCTICYILNTTDKLLSKSRKRHPTKWIKITLKRLNQLKTKTNHDNIHSLGCPALYLVKEITGRTKSAMDDNLPLVAFRTPIPHSKPPPQSPTPIPCTKPPTKSPLQPHTPSPHPKHPSKPPPQSSFPSSHPR